MNQTVRTKLTHFKKFYIHVHIHYPFYYLCIYPLYLFYYASQILDKNIKKSWQFIFKKLITKISKLNYF